MKIKKFEEFVNSLYETFHNSCKRLIQNHGMCEHVRCCDCPFWHLYSDIKCNEANIKTTACNQIDDKTVEAAKEWIRINVDNKIV